jgi:Domain of unknown function (DUF4062)
MATIAMIMAFYARLRPGLETSLRRLRVFVSSTLAELAEERRAVARAISAMRLTPVLFETGARAHPPRDVYRAYLAQSDLFIGMCWQRYGEVGTGMEVSGLEEELQLSRGLPRLLHVKSPALSASPAWPTCSPASRPRQPTLTATSAPPPSSADWCATTWGPS